MTYHVFDGTLNLALPTSTGNETVS